MKEFSGCLWHGCRKCHPECNAGYNRTMERNNLLKMAGYTVETIWECEWCDLKKDLDNKKRIRNKGKTAKY